MTSPQLAHDFPATHQGDEELYLWYPRVKYKSVSAMQGSVENFSGAGHLHRSLNSLTTMVNTQIWRTDSDEVTAGNTCKSFQPSTPDSFEDEIHMKTHENTHVITVNAQYFHRECFSQ
ncbi:hypothetical protein Q4I32_004431 [Leishmania shawi]|uniref:Uncharacterized protein n=1 Tax=Leishmania shawi TaxID=5680 RepID=A0AAW3BSW1_9TRYP